MERDDVRSVDLIQSSRRASTSVAMWFSSNVRGRVVIYVEELKEVNKIDFTSVRIVKL